MNNDQLWPKSCSTPKCQISHLFLLYRLEYPHIVCCAQCALGAKADRSPPVTAVAHLIKGPHDVLRSVSPVVRHKSLPQSLGQPNVAMLLSPHVLLAPQCPYTRKPHRSDPADCWFCRHSQSLRMRLLNSSTAHFCSSPLASFSAVVPFEFFEEPPIRLLSRFC